MDLRWGRWSWRGVKFSWPLPNYDTITSGFGPTEDAGGNDPRHEVRQVDDGLRELLHLRGDHFVEQ